MKVEVTASVSPSLTYGRRGIYERYFKRVLDILASLMAIVILSPVIAAVYVMVRLSSGSPVIFRHERPGLHEKIFTVYKFRTMTDARDSAGKLLPNSARVTKVGAFLRSTSLDELPQLFNILRGDMSLIGPRPLEVYFLPYYTDTERLRHSVRPGLTGLAQVNGRNNAEWEDRFRHDVDYATRITFVSDAKIILQSVLSVVKREGTLFPSEDFDVHRRRQWATEKFDEVGSEFWLTTNSMPATPAALPTWLTDFGSVTLTSLGRGAIALLLQSVRVEQKTVLLPAYTCTTVIAPFMDAGFTCLFYDLRDDLTPDLDTLYTDHPVGVFLHMGYFGFPTNSVLQTAIAYYRERSAVIVEDVTHTLFSVRNGVAASDYYVASLRKWMGIPSGGFLAGARGVVEPQWGPAPTFAELRQRALVMKGQYVKSRSTQSKEQFRQVFAEAERTLSRDPAPHPIDTVSAALLEQLDVAVLRSQRRLNFRTLLVGLADVHCVRPVFPVLPDGVCPLFLPVYVLGDRAPLREHLTEERIYCPIHWPIPAALEGQMPTGSRAVYDQILSIPCDQRYTVEDMNRVLEVLRSYTP